MSDATSNPPDALAELDPDWPVAKKCWGLAWDLHWIGFGILFALLAVYSLIALALVNHRKGFCRKPLFVAINSLLFVFGATRAVYLTLDPYESRQNGVEDPKWLTMLLFGIAYPCLTSAFSLIHFAFLEVTKLRVGPSRIQNIKFLSTVIVIHFIIVFATESSSSIIPGLKAFLIVCQSFYILWGLLLSGSFIYSGCKVIKHVEKVHEQLDAIEKSERLRNQPKQKSPTTKVAKITLVTSSLGFAVCGVHFYSMIHVYGMYSDVVNPSPWPWLAFQSSFRFVELVMACTIAYSVMQPAERAKNSKRNALTSFENGREQVTTMRVEPVDTRI